MKLNFSNIFPYGVICLFFLNCSSNQNDIKNIQYSHTDTIMLNTHNVYIDSITEQDYNRFKFAQETYPDTVHLRKERNILILPLEGNKTLVLKDSLSESDNVDQITYTYGGFLKDVGLYIVIAKYYETGECLLINSKTGAQTKIWGVPQLSPNQKRIVCYSSAIGYDIMPNGIQMWIVNKNGDLKLEWEFKQTAWAPVDIIWANDSSIYVTKQIPNYLSSTNKEEIRYIKISFNM